MAKNLRFFRLLRAVTSRGLVYGSFFDLNRPLPDKYQRPDAMTILAWLLVVFGFITVLKQASPLSGRKNIRSSDYAEAYNAGFGY